MLKTHVRPSRDLRNSYASIVKSLEEHDHIIITNNGIGESVLINIEDYAEYEKYLHRRFIYEELQKTKTIANDPNVELRDADDVFNKLEQKLVGRGL